MNILHQELQSALCNGTFQILRKDPRLMPNCMACRLVDTSGSSATSSATAALFSAEGLLPYARRRATKRRNVCLVGVGQQGNLRLNPRCANKTDELLGKKSKQLFYVLEKFGPIIRFPECTLRHYFFWLLSM